MSNVKCKNCYYGDICPCKIACKYFDPITDEAEDVIIERSIERNRREYNDAWNEYISEYND